MKGQFLQKLLTAAIIFSNLFICYTSSAQIEGGIITSNKVEIKFDERGKITSLPGAAIVKGAKYELTITVAPPISQHSKFITALTEKLDSTYYKLDNTEDFQNAALYKYLWGESIVTGIKTQVKELSDILKNKNPLSALNASKSDFSLFISKQFLVDNLFGENFIVTSNLDNVRHTGPLNKPLSFTIKDISAADTLQVSIFLEDLEKNFYKNFFTESRKLVAKELDKLKPKMFYQQARRYVTLKERFVALREDIIKESAEYICDREIIDDFDRTAGMFEEGDDWPASEAPATGGFPGGNLVGQMKEGWLQSWLIQWIWSLKGELAINPLPFTDKNLLALSTGYDVSKALAYDTYRESALALMKSSSELNDAKINFSAYDSLLKSKGTGKQVFSVQPQNNNLIQANDASAVKAQTITFLINTLKLPAVPDNQKDSIVYRYFDAADKLKGSKADDIPTVPNKYKVVAVGYNLVDKESFSVNESPTEVPNQSEAITQLNLAADGVGDLFSKAGPLPSILNNLLLSFRNPSNFIPTRSIGLNEVVVVGHGVTQLKPGDFILRAKFDRSAVFSLTMRDFRRTMITTEDLGRDLKNIFYKHNDPCEYLLLLYERKIQRLEIDGILLRKRTFSEAKSELKKVRVRILEKADSISLSMQKDKSILKKDRLLQQLDTYIAISTLISSPEFYTLPPKQYESKDPEADKSKYRNEFYAFAQEKKSVQKSSAIIVLNTESKKEFKITDSYYTAPSQRMTYSLGVAYIFNSFRRSEVTIADNKITNAADEEQVRLILALHYHLKPIILKDDRPIWKLTGDALQARFSIMAGLSFPKPLYNPHIGVAADIWTGVKLSTGCHFYRFTDYSIVNGQVNDQHSKYVYNGLFAAINIDPATFVKFLSSSIFK